MNLPAASRRLVSGPAPDGAGARLAHDADDLDGGWGSPGGISTGDLAAVAAAHLPELLAFAAALTGDTRQAGDVVAAVLARLPAASRPTTDRLDLRLRRLVLRRHRSSRRSGRHRPDHPPPAQPGGGTTGPDPLWSALDALPRRSRAVLVLRYHQHLSDEEVAAVIGRRPSVVRARAARGLAALRATTPDVPARRPDTKEPQR